MEVGARRGAHFQLRLTWDTTIQISKYETRDRKRNRSRGSTMKTKRLGNSDLSITPVGFGAWAIGGSGWEFGWGEQDDKASVAAIHRALELGVNWRR
jgi:hypothetical protein